MYPIVFYFLRYRNFHIRLLLVVLLIPVGLPAQINFVKSPDNPVLKRDTVMAHLPHDLIAISDPWVIKQGDTYKMWYTAGGLNFPTDSLLRSRICYATSHDGVTWEKYKGNPVLDVSYDGQWDSLGVETVSILYDTAAPSSHRYKMWYAGQYFNAYRYDIGYAWSPDGIQWTKYGSPVLQTGPPTEWDNGFLEGPSVLKDDKGFKMWYAGYDVEVDGSGTDGLVNIGLATSPDGILWEKFNDNPVFAVEKDAWDSHSVQDPHVVFENGQFYMWYGGNNVEGYGQQVGLATSTDGIHWTRYNGNPVLRKGNAGEWDANTASFPAVIMGADQYQMWYTGKDVADLKAGELDYFWEIGYASSEVMTDNIDILWEFSVMEVFPNPATMSMNIRLPEKVHHATLNIYDLSGRILIRQTSLSGRRFEVDTRKLAQGVYMATVVDGTRSWTAKILIQ